MCLYNNNERAKQINNGIGADEKIGKIDNELVDGIDKDG